MGQVTCAIDHLKGTLIDVVEPKLIVGHRCTESMATDVAGAAFELARRGDANGLREILEV